jgi:hypothetical protein
LPFAKHLAKLFDRAWINMEFRGHRVIDNDGFILSLLTRFVNFLHLLAHLSKDAPSGEGSSLALITLFSARDKEVV